jgi:hypothetical protein
VLLPTKPQLQFSFGAGTPGGVKEEMGTYVVYICPGLSIQFASRLALLGLQAALPPADTHVSLRNDVQASQLTTLVSDALEGIDLFDVTDFRV